MAMFFNVGPFFDPDLIRGHPILCIQDFGSFLPHPPTHAVIKPKDSSSNLTNRLENFYFVAKNFGFLHHLPLLIEYMNDPSRISKKSGMTS